MSAQLCYLQSRRSAMKASGMLQEYKVVGSSLPTPKCHTPSLYRRVESWEVGKVHYRCNSSLFSCVQLLPVTGAFNSCNCWRMETYPLITIYLLRFPRLPLYAVLFQILWSLLFSRGVQFHKLIRYI